MYSYVQVYIFYSGFFFTNDISQNLTRLSLEATEAAKERRETAARKGRQSEASPYCFHEGKTCTQNCARGFLKAFAVGFSVKYLIGVLPAFLMGKVFKR